MSYLRFSRVISDKKFSFNINLNIEYFLYQLCLHERGFSECVKRGSENYKWDTMSFAHRAICKEVYNYYNYKEMYKFTFKPINYYYNKRLKINLRLNRNLNKVYDSILINIHNRIMTKYITKLDFHTNQLTELPSSIGNFKLLKCIYLYNNQLTELPSSIGNLKSLTFISLYNNQITNLPTSMGNLKSLITLDLHNNKLMNLPSSLINIKSLNKLYISDNKITNLMLNVGDFKSLTKFYIYGNQLQSENIQYIRRLLPNCEVR